LTATSASCDLTGKITDKEERMGETATTRLSTKGQVVIPEEIRDRLGLKSGAQFVVLGEGDVVILKVIQAPEIADFEEIVGRARTAAKQAGLRKRDISQAIQKVRARG
jgi:AbrB family looped-hinge helix DNA binding protein